MMSRKNLEHLSLNGNAENKPGPSVDSTITAEEITVKKQYTPSDLDHIQHLNFVGILHIYKLLQIMLLQVHIVLLHMVLV